MRKDDRKAVAVILLAYLCIEVAGITCPILWFTGISCAGCGMSRAWLALLRFDVKTAFYYHPLFWCPPVAAIVFLFRKKLPDALIKILLYGTCIIFLAVYFIRMLNPNDTVVVFQPYQGIFFRMVNIFISHFTE